MINAGDVLELETKSVSTLLMLGFRTKQANCFVQIAGASLAVLTQS